MMPVISEGYRDLNAQLHASHPSYGVGGKKVARQVEKIAQAMETTDVLDYGCGKGTLAQALPFPIQQYDPAMEAFCGRPKPADLVVCTDVLEHIEPACLNAVLFDLVRVTRKVLFAIICTREARKKLPDGRNAHLIIKPAEWWLNRLVPLMELRQLEIHDTGLVVLMSPR